MSSSAAMMGLSNNNNNDDVDDDGTNLKARQLAAVKRMLSLSRSEEDDENGSSTSSAGGGAAPRWKLLVYDPPCRSIISPLMSVSELRAAGVTLHLSLASEREPIPDVPAVYFCEPTRANLTTIAQDCARGVYRSAHLNFVTKLPRDLMEEFARNVVRSDCLDRVASVHDRYLDYACPERGLFTLHRERSFARYHGPNTTDEQMERAMDEVAHGLFSVVATLGTVPVVRCPRGGAPEMVARRLVAAIAAHPALSRGGASARGGGGSHHRPLLVILDRSFDLVAPVRHCSTYQALVDDLLSHDANRVEFEVPPDENEVARRGRRRAPVPVVKRYDLDPDADPFYRAHRFDPFPEAVESNGVELQKVSDKEAAVRSKTSAGTGGGMPNHDHNPDDPSGLADAVDSLPALLERKRQLEVHTSILQAVMNRVAARDVPLFYELETALAAAGTGADGGADSKKAEVEALLRDPNKGDETDKIRLLAVYCSRADRADDVDDMTASVRAAVVARHGGDESALPTDARKRLDAGLRAVSYLRRLRSLRRAADATAAAATTFDDDAAVGGADAFSSFVRSAQTQATGLLAKAADRVSTMFGRSHKFPATRVVENLVEMRPNTEDDEYLYLDPRHGSKGGEVDVSRLSRGVRGRVREVTVFMVGGGCYAEYQNLQLLTGKTAGGAGAGGATGTGVGGGGGGVGGGGAGGGDRRVTYGCTELVDPTEFLGQLGELG